MYIQPDSHSSGVCQYFVDVFHLLENIKEVYESKSESESEKQLHSIKQASLFSRQPPDVAHEGAPDVSALAHPKHMRTVKVAGSLLSRERHQCKEHLESHITVL